MMRLSTDTERFARAGSVTLCYDTLGDPRDPTLLLIMGLGLQLVHWPERFCEALAAEGFHVVLFDNRDAGRSTHLSGENYTLEEMADDAVGLLDALGVTSAHVVGASLGGMIGQIMAVRHPMRVLSLASLMSTTGARGRGRTSLRLYRHMLARRPKTEAEAVERRVRVFQTIGSPGLPPDVDEIRRATQLAFSRDPEARRGRRRQQAALRRAGDRTAELRTMRVPTVVIHGSADPVCHVSGGEATAEAIRGARLVVIEGMGHDLPPAAWTTIVGAIGENALRTQSSR